MDPMEQKLKMSYPKGVPDHMEYFRFLARHQTESIMAEKPKEKARTPFFHFMMEIRRSQQAQGIPLASMDELRVLASPEWQKMDEKARKPYQDMTREQRTARRDQRAARAASPTTEQRPLSPAPQADYSTSTHTSTDPDAENHPEEAESTQIAAPPNRDVAPSPPGEPRPRLRSPITMCLRLTSSPPPARPYTLTRPSIMNKAKVEWKPLRKPKQSTDMPSIPEVPPTPSQGEVMLGDYGTTEGADMSPIPEVPQTPSQGEVEMLGDDDTTEDAASEDFGSEEATEVSMIVDVAAVPSEGVDFKMAAADISSEDSASEDAGIDTTPVAVAILPEVEALVVEGGEIAAGAEASPMLTSSAIASAIEMLTGDVESEDVATEKSDDGLSEASVEEATCSIAPSKAGPVAADVEAQRARKKAKKAKAIQMLLKMLMEDDDDD